MNFSSSLSSFVCIVSTGFVCTAGAQTLSGPPADTPSFASSTLPGTAPLQRSEQAAAVSPAVEPAAPASANAAPELTRPAASAAVQAGTRAHGTLLRAFVPARPHRAQVASTPTDDGWRSDTLYASPYAKSPYDAPADSD
ncbi:hypothetical protein [Burkholderia gladioli]|uniref:Lipoprotein n=1 Tax=Burkholderia gladioli (strain BSR3) TaxID=999541 RepID=F2LT57_BURGS|nr:hypothetical protein [Burkholderia gladioli]AEA65933.1 hypothetical protein bgla_4p1520 [Burkholderia gladioli BSR3]MBW5286827.1 hypothetical protein [Burkholderia gladioli]